MEYYECEVSYIFTTPIITLNYVHPTPILQAENQLQFSFDWKKSRKFPSIGKSHEGMLFQAGSRLFFSFYFLNILNGKDSKFNDVGTAKSYMLAKHAKM
ncbi:hypothetical protein M8C21_014177, partial [Ambrosia artemisiifolia]